MHKACRLTTIDYVYCTLYIGFRVGFQSKLLNKV